MTGAEVALPVERTALAWRRTALAATANLVMLAKLIEMGGFGWRPTGVVPLCGLVAMAGVTTMCLLRDRQLRHVAVVTAASGYVAVVTAVTAAVAAAVVAVVLAHPH